MNSFSGPVNETSLGSVENWGAKTWNPEAATEEQISTAAVLTLHWQCPPGSKDKV